MGIPYFLRINSAETQEAPDYGRILACPLDKESHD